MLSTKYTAWGHYLPLAHYRTHPEYLGDKWASGRGHHCVLFPVKPLITESVGRGQAHSLLLLGTLESLDQISLSPQCQDCQHGGGVCHFLKAYNRNRYIPAPSLFKGFSCSGNCYRNQIKHTNQHWTFPPFFFKKPLMPHGWVLSFFFLKKSLLHC